MGKDRYIRNRNQTMEEEKQEEKQEKEQAQTEAWIPVQTLYNKELLIADYLKKINLTYYLPMKYELRDNPEDSEMSIRTLVPAIHNLLFIRHSYNEEWCRKFSRECPYPVYFLKRERDGKGYCTVREKEMQNFMRAGNPDIQGTRFIDSEKLKGKKLTPVRIIKPGPLFGITGRFIRYGGKHYIAIQMYRSATLLKVSYTWCEEITEEELDNPCPT